MPIQHIAQFDQFDSLLAECKDLLNRIPFQNNVTQLSLQVNDPTISDWYGSCGRIEKPGAAGIIETDYSYIQPELKGSAIEKWINSLGKPVFRTRLLYMNPKQCYSIHKDPLPRFHLPVITHPQCLMCFPDHKIMQFLLPGESYLVNTMHRHTFINCSDFYRVHLVAVTDDATI